MENDNQNNYRTAVAALVLGLLIGFGGGYYYSLAKSQGSATKVQQTATATSSNPYTQIETNPYNTIKINPFQ